MGLTLKKRLFIDDLEFIRAHVPVNKLRNMTGVITGYTGWFGRWIRASLDFMECKYIKLDTRDLHPITCDYCIHLAPRDVTDLIALLDKTDVQHVLFTSSGSVYDVVPSENCIEKRANEDLFLASDLPVNIMRGYSFIGAGICQKDLAPGVFIKQALNNQHIHISDMNSIRTYMYMADMVIWLLNILLADKGNIYNVGATEPITIMELAETIIQKTGSKSRYSAWDLKEDPRPAYIPNIQYAQEDLGLRVYTDLNTALDKTIEWERQ